MSYSTLQEQIERIQARQRGKESLARALENLDAVEQAPACDTCNDLGVVSYSVPLSHELFGKLQPCPGCEQGQRIQERQWSGKLIGAQLPKELHICTFERWETSFTAEEKQGKRLAFEACQLFCKTDRHDVSLMQAWRNAGRTLQGDVIRNSLVLYGPTGLGKSGMVASCVNYLLAMGEMPLYTRADDLFSSVQATYKKDAEEASEEIKARYREAGLLVLDELSDGATADRRQILESVIRHRYNNRLPTLVTSNYTHAELEDLWGIRTLSALRAMAHWIPMGGVPVRDEWQPPADMEPF